MTKKDILTRYKNTVFGFLWTVINPLIQMIVISSVFSFFTKWSTSNYYQYLYVGLSIWNFFSVSLNGATSCFVNERELIKKTTFAREVIPISIILSNFLRLIIALLILIIPIFSVNSQFIYYLPQLILGVFMLLTFTIGISFLTSSLNVRFRDVAFFVQAFITVWFYITPIIYSTNMLPSNLKWIWMLNPMTSTIQLFQTAFIASPVPDIKIVILNIVVIIITFTIGFTVFQRESRNFDDWV